MSRLRQSLGRLQEFLRLETTAGFLLMAAALLALLLANTPVAPQYNAALAWHPPGLNLSLLHLVNDGLMAVFFLLVGLEIKRELLIGELSSLRHAMLPLVAAVGGMALPAAIYVAINWAEPANLRGWAIPAATDIAFALGILALLGQRVPAILKLFLTALAILDDLGAIIIIALFYTEKLVVSGLAVAAAGLLLLWLLNRRRVTALWPYIIIGAVVWGGVLVSGVHATLAGVAVAFCIPLRTAKRNAESTPLARLEHALHPWVAYGILPIFALANAGLSFAGMSLSALLAPVPLGIALGLLLGKPLGVLLAVGVAVRFRWAQWPAGVNGAQMLGVSLLCGIGFTMSLFIGGLAFPSADLQNAVKLGVFAGSILAALAGYSVLRQAAGRAQ